jgi:hypothetical protein
MLFVLFIFLPLFWLLMTVFCLPFLLLYFSGATSMLFSVPPVQTVTDCMELFEAGSWITFGTPFLAVAILPVLRGVVLDVQMVTVCTALFGACSWITWATSPSLEVSLAMTIPALPANIASDIAATAILLSRVVFILLDCFCSICSGLLERCYLD